MAALLDALNQLLRMTSWALVLVCIIYCFIVLAVLADAGYLFHAHPSDLTGARRSATDQSVVNADAEKAA